jgi:hypothetical protein
LTNFTTVLNKTNRTDFGPRSDTAILAVTRKVGSIVCAQGQLDPLPAVRKVQKLGPCFYQLSKRNCSKLLITVDTSCKVFTFEEESFVRRTRAFFIEMRGLVTQLHTCALSIFFYDMTNNL